MCGGVSLGQQHRAEGRGEEFTFSESSHLHGRSFFETTVCLREGQGGGHSEALWHGEDNVLEKSLQILALLKGHREPGDGSRGGMWSCEQLLCICSREERLLENKEKKSIIKGF